MSALFSDGFNTGLRAWRVVCSVSFSSLFLALILSQRGLEKGLGSSIKLIKAKLDEILKRSAIFDLLSLKTLLILNVMEK